MWNLGKDTDEAICKEEIERHRWREQTHGHQGGRRWGDLGDWDFDICTLLYIK